MTVKMLILIPLILWGLIAIMLFFPEFLETVMLHYDLSDMIFTGIILTFIIFQLVAKLKRKSADQ